jgi:hypothetical protein
MKNRVTVLVVSALASPILAIFVSAGLASAQTGQTPSAGLLEGTLSAATTEVLSTTLSSLTPGKILFQDDFSDPASGWVATKTDYGLFEYTAGAYHIHLAKDNFTTYSLLPDQDYSDVSMEVDVTQTAGPEDAVFGLVCRANGGLSDSYRFLFVGNGSYAILKSKGNLSDLGTFLRQTQAILPGKATNHIRVDCAGSTLALYANGQELYQTQDPDLTSGQIGLYVAVGPSGKGNIDLLFDNFVVREATPSTP